jgi:hypothetical protein
MPDRGLDQSRHSNQINIGRDIDAPYLDGKGKPSAS